MLATPFVQGRLREESLTVEALSQCAVTGRELRLRIDSDLRCETTSDGAAPFVFEPRLDWQQFSAPNIIHDY